METIPLRKPTLIFLRDWRPIGIMSRMQLALSEFNCRLAITMTILFFMDSGICFAHQNASKRTGPELTLKCQTDGVRLEGKLVDRTFYGPPGLGKETHERAFLLDLMSPITVEPGEGATANSSTCSMTFKHVHQVQLFFDPSKNSEAPKDLGKVVVAIGLLDEAHLPSQHTDVIMDVETLRAK
jgi:hypothetical protein